MTGNDKTSTAFRPWLADLPAALALLTRIPLPAGFFADLDPQRPGAHAAWAYPLVGLVAGAAMGLGVSIALALNLPAAMAALVGIAAGLLVTGALHEDGLADCADGFWGGWTRERRLEIMKDSQIGTYGVLALFLMLGLRWSAMVVLIDGAAWGCALIAAAVASRAAMVGVMGTLPNARVAGLSSQTGRPPRPALLIALGIGLAALLLFAPAPFAALFALGGVALAVGLIARSKIGGQTGDVLGATQVCGEVAVLAACASVLQ